MIKQSNIPLLFINHQSHSSLNQPFFTPPPLPPLTQGITKTSSFNCHQLNEWYGFTPTYLCGSWDQNIGKGGCSIRVKEEKTPTPPVRLKSPTILTSLTLLLNPSRSLPPVFINSLRKGQTTCFPHPPPHPPSFWRIPVRSRTPWSAKCRGGVPELAECS